MQDLLDGRLIGLTMKNKPIIQTGNMNKDTLQSLSEETAEKLGAEIAGIFKLRRDSEHKDRWQTTWGSKTNKGIARSVVALVEKYLK